jgi:serine/threonine-protein kinase HipA
MTSDEPSELFVWIWLPGATEPVVAGRIEALDGIVAFNYGRSYLGRDDAISIYGPELPLERGVLMPRDGLTIAGCIDDAGPDAWGKRVIMHRVLGAAGSDRDPAQLVELAYLAMSGSDRIGALDFQSSPTEYVPRTSAQASLEDLLGAADLVEARMPLPPGIADALLHGSSIGGAWPKALVDAPDRKWIAKFSSTSSRYPVIQGEFLAMELARRAGLDVAPVRLERVMDRWVLLVERFDRVHRRSGWERRPVVSALTMLGLHELIARYASYGDLAQIIRQRFAKPRETLRELFARITFNILVGNTDDHARNHAAFWDGTQLELTPAFDICPQPRAGGEVAQAMFIEGDWRMSQIAGCVERCHPYLLTPSEAREIVDHQLDVIRAEWSDACDMAQLGDIDREYFRQRQFLNPYALEGYRDGSSP